MTSEHSRVTGIKRVPKSKKKEIQDRAIKILDRSSRNKTLRVFLKNGYPVALVARIPSNTQRIRNQQSIFFCYNKKNHHIVKTWIKQQFRELATASPKFTQICFSNEEDAIYGSYFTKTGYARYEVLSGDTHRALSNLIKDKAPPSNFDHLDLKIIDISSLSKIQEIIKLQKNVSLKSKTGTFFSHTKAQLQKNEDEYKQIISKKTGLILGVYRKNKLLGLMIAGIYKDDVLNNKSGGISFFLHPSIQGLGVVKTGYLLLLKYLLKNKVKKFYGGTSQPAIKALGQIMKRQVQFVIYVK